MYFRFVPFGVRLLDRAALLTYNQSMKTWATRLVAAILVVIVLVLAVRYHREVLAFLSDKAQLEAWLSQLGPWGPLGIIALNSLQVIVAFIPGYVMQVAAGFFFGFPLGAVYSLIGMAFGGIIAIGLARWLGRPLVIRMIGETRLNRWEHVAHLDSLPVWFILMLGPFGDIPYYIAGLTSLPIWKIIAVAVLVRTPTVFVSAAVGAGSIDYRNPFFIAGAAVFMVLAVLAMRYQSRMEGWIDQVILPRVLQRTMRQDPVEPPPPPAVRITEIQDYDAASH